MKDLHTSLSFVKHLEFFLCLNVTIQMNQLFPSNISLWTYFDTT